MTDRRVALSDLMGAAEVASHLGVLTATVYSWKYRGRMPEPDLQLEGTELWLRQTIDAWAVATGRVEAAR